MHVLLVCLILAGALAAPAAWAGDTLRCDDRIVATEALAAEVLAACGEPDHRDSWAAPPHYAIHEEQWYYNFGSSRFVQILRFRNGRLASIEADGYGFDGPPATRCAPADIVAGLSKLRLLHRCGLPSTRETFDELRPLRKHDPAWTQHAVKPVRRERWVYDFGPDARLRVVTLRNGRVSDVESGERGSAGYE